MTRRKVLVVEDDPIQIQVLISGLAKEGYDVVVARDAVQAVALARKEEPSLVLLDIGLPGGDGYLVIRRLRSIAVSANVPIIAVSARSADGEREKMLALGVTDYFQKPVDVPPLVTRVSELLGLLPTAS